MSVLDRARRRRVCRLLDWGSRLPNDLAIERVVGEKVTPHWPGKRASEISQIAEIQLPFLQIYAQAPPDQITPRARPLAWGVPVSAWR